jgi:hypothetical protein
MGLRAILAQGGAGDGKQKRILDPQVMSRLAELNRFWPGAD